MICVLVYQGKPLFVVKFSVFELLDKSIRGCWCLLFSIFFSSLFRYFTLCSYVLIFLSDCISLVISLNPELHFQRVSFLVALSLLTQANHLNLGFSLSLFSHPCTSISITLLFSWLVCTIQFSFPHRLREIFVHFYFLFYFFSTPTTATTATSFDTF